MITIAGDKNQFAKGSHYESNNRKHKQIKRLGYGLIELSLPVADYILVNDKVQEVIDRSVKRGIPLKKMDLLGTYNLAIDSKKTLVEVAGNLCNSNNHERIKDDLLRAKRNGIHIIWLIENTEKVCCINDLFAKGKTPVMEHGWKQTKYGEKWLPIHKTKVPCLTLAKTLYTMQYNRAEYDIEFLFTTPEKSGEEIIKLLTKDIV